MNSMFTAIALLSIHAWAQPGGQVSFSDLQPHGNGCPAGSTSIYLSPDKQVFTVIYDDFQTELDQGSRLPMQTKMCRLSMKMKMPRGWTFALTTLDTRGYVHLDSGVKAWLAVQFRAGIRPFFDIPKQEIKGPIQDNYVRSVTIPTFPLVDCREELPVIFNTAMVIQRDLRSRGGGLMTVDTTDGQVVQKFRLQWKSCRPLF